MSCFIKALNRTNRGRIPVWFMRQAGRYLPEYMAIKNKSSFKVMSTTPDLIKDITLQPLKRFDLDAAILFSDILTPLAPMGADFQFGSKGPELKTHGPEALLNLKTLNPENDMNFVKIAVGLIKNNIKVPLIGFVGAPFTLASYLIEGGGSREFRATKKFMFDNQSEFMSGLDHISNELIKYINYQIESGTEVIQIFDSWGGVLSAKDYDTFVAPSLHKIFNGIKPIPTIMYVQPTMHLLPVLSKLKVSAISLGFRDDIDVSYKILKDCGADVAIQGNLDPMAVTTDYIKTKKYVLDILDKAKRIGSERFIFNVGQGFTPQTKIETVSEIVKEVKAFY